MAPTAHNQALAKFVAAAKVKARYATVLHRRFGYTRQQLNVLAAGMQPGVKTYGSRPLLEANQHFARAALKARLTINHIGATHPAQRKPIQ